MVVDLTAAKHVTHGGALGLDAGEPQFQLQPSGFARLGAAPMAICSTGNGTHTRPPSREKRGGTPETKRPP